MFDATFPIFSFKISSIFPPLNTVLTFLIIQYNSKKIKEKQLRAILWENFQIKEVIEKEIFHFNENVNCGIIF